MTGANWQHALKLCLAFEGGFVDHPKDPGGPTNKGVTQAVYDAYRARKGLTLQSVKFITSIELDDIYFKQYWTPIRGNDLPAGLDYAVFDFAVNSGVARAAKFLQTLVGINDIDGLIGEFSLAQVAKFAAVNEEALITRYCNERMEFLRSLPTFDTFGKGWTRRVIGSRVGFDVEDNGVIDFSIKMARADNKFIMPVAIGSKPDEIAAKAVVSNDYLPSAPIPYADFVKRYQK